MTKQELLAQKALYESHVAFKEGELRSFKDKLKSIESALQELEKGDQMDMFDEEHNYGDFSDSVLVVKRPRHSLNGSMNFRYKFKE